jgi:stage II sporulation protein M
MRYKYWILIAIGLFVTGLVIGLGISAAMPASIARLFSEELSALEELAATFGPFQATTAIFIYFKNASVLLLSFIFSPILCVVPVLVLVFNGSLISLLSVMVVEQESIGLLLAGLLPHGIFEIPAIIIGEAAALSFGTTAIIALLSKERKNSLLPVFKQNLKYLLLALILLVPAAIIETFVTPLLLQ